MNVQSADGSYTWTKFLTLTNAARVRNAGFDIPIAPVRNYSSNSGSASEKINPTLRAGSFYKTPKANSNRVTLGNRFDSYA